MEIVLVIGGVAVAWWLFTRVFVYFVAAFYVVIGLAVVAALALWAYSAFGPLGALAVVALAVVLWRRGRDAPYVPPTGNYGYGPGDMMPPSPKRPDGRPY